MPEYRITFGTKYDHEEHPLLPGVTSKTYVTVLADDPIECREIALNHLGRYWAFDYAEPEGGWASHWTATLSQFAVLDRDTPLAFQRMRSVIVERMDTSSCQLTMEKIAEIFNIPDWEAERLSDEELRERIEADHDLLDDYLTPTGDVSIEITAARFGTPRARAVIPRRPQTAPPASRGNDRPRGVLLRKVDSARIIAEVRAQKDVPPEHEIRLGIGELAVGENGGKHSLICGEGVGWPITDAGVRVDVYVSSPGHMAVYPTFEGFWEREEFLTYVTDETVDLADFVRVFGDRLENNFWIWYRELSGAQVG